MRGEAPSTERVLIYISGGVAERLNAAVSKFRDRHPGPFRLMPIRTLTLGFRPSQYPRVTPLPTKLVGKTLATAESLGILIGPPTVSQSRYPMAGSRASRAT